MLKNMMKCKKIIVSGMTSSNYYLPNIIERLKKNLFIYINTTKQICQIYRKEGKEMLIITTVKQQKKQDERLQQIAQGYKEQNNELLSQIFDLMIENKQLKKALIKD